MTLDMIINRRSKRVSRTPPPFFKINFPIYFHISNFPKLDPPSPKTRTSPTLELMRENSRVLADISLFIKNNHCTKTRYTKYYNSDQDFILCNHHCWSASSHICYLWQSCPLATFLNRRGIKVRLHIDNGTTASMAVVCFMYFEPVAEVLCKHL